MLYHRFPKISMGFCLAEKLGTNNRIVEFLEINSAAGTLCS